MAVRAPMVERAVGKYQREMWRARKAVGLFLVKNGFPEAWQAQSFNSAGFCKSCLGPSYFRPFLDDFRFLLLVPKEVNSRKEGRFGSVTYPLHEAVKQNDAYITWKLLLFGANPKTRDTWFPGFAYDF